MLITTDATPNHLVFYFQGSVFPLSCSCTWCGSMCKVQIALQELQTFALMLHKVTFWLSGKVVALHLDNNTAKAYLCNQGGTASHPFSRLACCIVNLAIKDDTTPIPAYIPTHLNVEADYLSQGRLVPE